MADQRQRETHPRQLSRRDFVASTSALSVAGAAMAAGAGEVTVPKEKGTAMDEQVSTGIVDCQSHIFVPEIVEIMERRRREPYVEWRDGQRYIVMGSWVRKFRPKHTDITGKLADMDAHGITTTMLSINDPGPEWFGPDGAAVAQIANDYVSDFSRRYPGRFEGLMVLPLQHEAAAQRELERCVKQRGMKGILLYSNLAGAWPDEPQFRWLFTRAEELGVPILLHPAKPTTIDQVQGYNLTSLMGNMFENTIALARIIASGILDDHPDLKLVCPHLGGTLPYIAGRFDHQVTVLKRSNQDLKRKPSEYLQHIYMDIVSPQALAMEFAYRLVGAGRLLFSSDHPWVDPGLVLGELNKVQMPAEDRQRILSGTAQQLFTTH